MSLYTWGKKSCRLILCTDMNYDILNFTGRGHCNVNYQLHCSMLCSEGISKRLLFCFKRILRSNSWLLIISDFTVYTMNESPFVATVEITPKGKSKEITSSVKSSTISAKKRKRKHVEEVEEQEPKLTGRRVIIINSSGTLFISGVNWLNNFFLIFTEVRF